MEFYNMALEEAKKKNYELTNACREVLMDISTTIEDMTLDEKIYTLKELLTKMDAN